MKLRQILIGLCLTCLTHPVWAKGLMEKPRPWRMGLDVGYQHVPVKGEYKDILEQDHLAFNLFVGYRFNQWFGLDIGFSWNARNGKSKTLQSGQTLFGLGPVSAEETYTAKIRFKNTHADLYTYYPVREQMELFAMFGAGFSRQAIGASREANSATLFDQINDMQGRTRFVLRGGLGAQTMWTKQVGIRMMWVYETLSWIQLRSHPGNGRADPFGNGHSLLIGLFYKLE